MLEFLILAAIGVRRLPRCVGLVGAAGGGGNDRRRLVAQGEAAAPAPAGAVQHKMTTYLVASIAINVGFADPGLTGGADRQVSAPGLSAGLHRHHPTSTAMRCIGLAP